ncbi:MAG TPA: hypothetical protein VIK91_23770 [Nannocystis sp.]
MHETPADRTHLLALSWWQAGESAWNLPPEFVEFVGITCYMDDTGWKHLSLLLDRQARRSPAFVGLLVVSRSGFLECATRSLPHEICAFIQEHKGRVAVRMVPDRPGQLAQAKGWACRTSARHQTWVGSANLTRPGLGDNIEAGVHLFGEGSFSKFAEAVRSLAHRGIDMSEPLVADELTRLLRRRDDTDERAQPPRPWGSLEQQSLWPLARPSGPLVPIVETDAMTAAMNWLAVGRRLARQHGGDSYAISYPLKRHIDAGLLRHEEHEHERTGIRVADEQKALYIPLLPPHWKKGLRTFNQTLGRIISRYAAVIGGVIWCPKPLLSRLQCDWRAESEKFDCHGLRRRGPLGPVPSSSRTIRGETLRRDGRCSAGSSAWVGGRSTGVRGASI